MSLKDIKVFLSFVLIFGFLFSFATVSAGLEADPNGTWDGNADWGLALTYENTTAGVSQHGDFGVSSTSRYTQMHLPGSLGAFNVYSVVGFNSYLVEVDNEEPYSYQLKFDVDAGYYGTSTGTLSWDIENAANDSYHVPNDYSAVIDNIGGSGIGSSPDINMRSQSSAVFSGSDTATLIYEDAVDVSVSPSSQSGDPGDAVDYTVTVSNTGSYADSYSLSVSDSLGWSYSLDSSSLSIPAGGSDSTTLHVTLGTGSDEITVTADGSLASDNASCTATAMIIPSLNLWIEPLSQSGYPGDSLSYTVRVKNNGNVTDSYDFNITDDAGWDFTLENEVLDMISAGDNETVSLGVTVPDGVPVGTVDNIEVIATSQLDNTVSEGANCTAQVSSTTRVEVSISPDEQEGAPAEDLEYEVNVKNTGSEGAVFDVSVVGTQDWRPSVTSENVDLAPGEDDNLTLRVQIPSNVDNGATSTITVTAESGEVSDSENCKAIASVPHRVSVSITPSENAAIPGENAIFNVEVRNTGSLIDSYDLTVSDDARPSWGPTLDDALLEDVSPGGSSNTTLRVTIPEGTLENVSDEITVTATSQGDNAVSDSATCTARSSAAPEVTVTIIPENQSGSRGENLVYDVKVQNSGTIPDNYTLTVTDDAGWDITLSDNSIDNIIAGENRTVDLTVTIPEDAQPDTMDNVKVVVNSREYGTVTDNAICIAHSLPINRSVEVSISPSEKEWMVGKSTSFTVTIKNTGDVPDNYILSLSDNAAWDTSLPLDSDEDVPAGENKTVSLNVTIPSSVSPDSVDNIAVTATSGTDPTVYDSDSCIGRALILKSVKVEVSTSFKSGRPGEEISFEVIVTNTGQADGNFNLSATATPGWSPSVEPSSLILASGESDNAKLIVEIPSNIGENETGILEARASLMEDSDITSADIWRVGVSGSLIGGGISLPSLWTIIWIIIIGAVIVVVIIVVRYLLSRSGKERSSRVLSDLNRQKRGKRSSVLRDLSE